jgi:hypothetical protein
MVFLSPDFAKLRFRKTLRQKEGTFRLNGPLYQLFFAVEENRSVAQIAAELDISLAAARQGLERLCAQGMIAPLADQGPVLPNRSMAQIQHQFGLALGGPARASSELLQVVRQIGEDGRHINLAQARTFLNRLCDRIPDAGARQLFRTRAVALLQERMAVPVPQPAPAPPAARPATRGRTHAIISAIIKVRSRGNPRHVPRLKEAFRRYGIDPDRCGPDTPDDPRIVARLERMVQKTGIALPASREGRSAAELRRLLDAIIKERHGDTPSLARSLRNQLRLKGIHPGDDETPRRFNPVILDQFHQLAGDLGVDTTPIKAAPVPSATRGRTKQILDRILQHRHPEAPHRVKALRTKLFLRGIDPDAYTDQTPDDPGILHQVEEIAKRLGLAP